VQQDLDFYIDNRLDKNPEWISQWWKIKLKKDWNLVNKYFYCTSI